MTEQMYAKITDHVEQAKGRAVWQYKGKTNWDAGREIWATRIQNIENVLFQMLGERSISTSVGIQLDRLAANYNVVRDQGESDADLRTRLQVEISLIRSSGQVPVLNFNLSRLVSPRSIFMRQIFPLTILMCIYVDDFSEIPADELDRINNVMQSVKAAGVRLDIGLHLNSPTFIVSQHLLNGNAGEGVATLPDGSDGGAFVKSII